MFIERMKGQDYIDKTREYLDYLEEHLNNVKKAFQEISDACGGMCWVSDDYQWFTVRDEVELHDLSKFSQKEFMQYRQNFFPVGGEKDVGNDDAWEHHKKHNRHHHETAYKTRDILHMVIDWTAMSYKFGDTAQEYYETNKGKINLSTEHISYMYQIFDKIKEHNEKS